MLLVVFAALTFSGLLIALLLNRRIARFNRRPVWASITILLLGLGVVLLLVDSDRLGQFWRTRQWPQVTGAIVDAQVIRAGDVNGPLIIYEYRTGDSTYVDSSHVRAPGFGGKRKRFEATEHILEDYQPGTEITVYYNPDDPRISTITPGPPWNVFGQLGLGGTLYLCGVVLFFILLLPSKRDTELLNNKKGRP